MSEQQEPQQPLDQTSADTKKTGKDKEHWWFMFVPTRSFFFTPLLIDINIALFLAMLITSGSFDTLFAPDTELLIRWGANYKPETLDGQWWRLFTSIFEHIGIIHLAMNMYALLYVGIFLEPMLGKHRYITAYIVTGIMGSLASLWWHDNTVGAGASGAIFGLYGVFLALLTTNFIEKGQRQALLRSIGIFVVYNLAYGMKGGIDNAAHIGGLLSGLVVGYIYFLTLRNKQAQNKWLVIAGVLAAGAIAVFVIVPKLSDPFAEYDKIMGKVGEYEHAAVQYDLLPSDTPDDKKISYLHDSTLPAWNNSLTELSKLESVRLPEILAKRRDQVKEYFGYRLRLSERTMKKLNEKTTAYDNEIDDLNRKINTLYLQLKDSTDSK